MGHQKCLRAQKAVYVQPFLGGFSLVESAQKKRGQQQEESAIDRLLAIAIPEKGQVRTELVSICLLAALTKGEQRFERLKAQTQVQEKR